MQELRERLAQQMKEDWERAELYKACATQRAQMATPLRESGLGDLSGLIALTAICTRPPVF
jgi:hypothetical protein